MMRRGKHIVRWPGFDNLPRVEDHQTVRNMSDDREIVGDEQVCDPVLILETNKKVQDGGLHRCVQRGRRLVADHQPGVTGKCPRNRHALSFTTAQLSRVPIQIRLPEPHRTEQLTHAGPLCRSIG
jgi:hypothetical protein